MTVEGTFGRIDTGLVRGIIRGLVVTGILLCSSIALADEMTDEERQKLRGEIDAKTQEILNELYEESPDAKSHVENAAGYAVFSNFGMKIFVAGGGSGKGLALNNKTGERTYMKMLEIQAGLGFGIKKFKLVWIFLDSADFDDFVNAGWEFGAQATAAAAMGDDGSSIQGAVPVSDGVWLYQLTGSGLALELTAKSTRYFKNDDLN